MNLKVEADGYVLTGLPYGRPSWEEERKWNSIQITTMRNWLM